MAIKPWKNFAQEETVGMVDGKLPGYAPLAMLTQRYVKRKKAEMKLQLPNGTKVTEVVSGNLSMML